MLRLRSRSIAPRSTIGSSETAAFARAADSYRNRSVAPIAIKVEPGPLFRLRSIRILNSAGAEFSEEELPARIVGLKPGDPAAASDLRAAEARIVDYFRAESHPLAKVLSIAPVVDHAADVDGRDGDRRARSGGAVRRGDDRRA